MSLLRFISEANVTCLLVTDLPDPTVLEPEFFLSRGILRFHRLMVSSKVERCVTVEKLRGSAHDTNPRMLHITQTGITVEAGKKVPRSMLRLLQAVPADAR